MCNYTGDPTDVQRFSQAKLSEDEVNKATKKLLGEPQEKCNKTRLAPFYLTNPVPQVSVFVLFTHYVCDLFSILSLIFDFSYM